jgi:hypothetical protein
MRDRNHRSIPKEGRGHHCYICGKKIEEYYYDSEGSKKFRTDYLNIINDDPIFTHRRAHLGCLVDKIKSEAIERDKAIIKSSPLNKVSSKHKIVTS